MPKARLAALDQRSARSFAGTLLCVDPVAGATRGDVTHPTPAEPGDEGQHNVGGPLRGGADDERPIRQDVEALYARVGIRMDYDPLEEGERDYEEQERRQPCPARCYRAPSDRR